MYIYIYIEKTHTYIEKTSEHEALEDGNSKFVPRK
jgi:hypothetical protein